MISKLKILFVDDDAITRMVMVKQLSMRYAEVVEASDGMEGVRVCLKERPDIVVTDMSMPRMNGLKMIAEIRKTAPDQKFILVSGFSEILQDETYIPVILKPLTAEVLFKEIDRLAGR